MNAIPPGDTALEEVYDIAFALGEQGPGIQGSHDTLLPFGKGFHPGYTIDLPSGAGFIEYMALTAVDGEYRIALMHLIWYGPSA